MPHTHKLNDEKGKVDFFQMDGRIMRKIAMVVENYYPSMSGVPVVMQYLSEGLVQNGYQVDVLTCGYHQGEKLEKVEFHNGVSIYRYYIRQSPQYQVIGEQSEIQAFINKARSEEYECAIITCAQCWTTNILLPILDQIKAKKVFYPITLPNYTIFQRNKSF